MPAPRLALAALLLAAPLAARAQPVEGVYLGAGAGLNLAPEAQDGGVRLHGREPGFAGLLSLGWGFGHGWRAEIEGSIRGNAIDRLTLGSATATESGTYARYGAMANLLFDLDLSGFGIAPGTTQPYLGLGAGVAWNEVRDARLRIGGTAYRLESADPQFAYQAIVGSAFGLGAVLPGLSVTAEYRFLGTLDPKFSLTRTAGPAVPGVPASIEPGNANHSLLLGLRYAFNPPPAAAAAPVPAPIAAPETARTYLVFFDWDRAELNERARQVITEAAGSARRLPSTRIEVAGHADRSGSPQVNQALSRRRADAVATELVRQGVTREEIAVTAFGETRPLVPTADGVREPQNRRVEIVLR